MGTGDFNADQRSDMLWRHDDGRVATWLLDGNTLVGAGVIADAPDVWSVASTGDFNGDDRSDVLWQNDGGQAAVWFLNGTSLAGAAVAGDPISGDWMIS